VFTAEKEQELLLKLKVGVIEYDEDSVRDAANEVVELGMDAGKAVFEGLVPGMEEVGRLYRDQEYFIPETLMCAYALSAGLDILKPQMENREGGDRGVVTIGNMTINVAGLEARDLAFMLLPKCLTQALMNQAGESI